MPSRKDELIESLIAYFLEHGLSDSSLRPLAAGTGTSARLLIYHFGSKEGLLTEVLEAMQAHVQRSFQTLQQRSHPARGKAREAPLKLFWTWAIAANNYPYLKRLYELQMLALHDPDNYAKYLERNAKSWFEIALGAMSDPLRSPELATLCAAVFDGLFIELMATGERKRTTLALDCFIKIANQSSAASASAPKARR